MAPDASLTPGLAAAAADPTLPTRFASAWQSLDCPGHWRRLLVAVSGGADSLALLHLLHATRSVHRLELEVAHADHGIHPDSALVARRVAEAAGRLGLPVLIGRLALGAGASETLAREARHAWLESVRRSSGADGIALAHHRDDQVETVLLRVLGGSGPAGLAGIQPRRGRLVRPLLEFGRAELEAWVRAQGIEPWSDPSNADPRHDRAWVRTTLVPLLQAHDPRTAARLLRVSAQAAVDRRAWDAVLEELPGLDLRASASRLSLDALTVAHLDPALGQAVLQAAARRLGFVLGPRRAASALRLLRQSASGRRLELGAGWQAEVAFGRLEISRPAGAPPSLRLEGREGEARFGEWTVRWRPAPTPGPLPRDGWATWVIGEDVILRAPVAGDRVLPLGGVGRRTVARMLQEARIPRSRRTGWPVIEVGGQVVWIAGVCRGAAAQPATGSTALLVEVRHG